jgi:hypothetical protein
MGAHSIIDVVNPISLNIKFKNSKLKIMKNRILFLVLTTLSVASFGQANPDSLDFQNKKVVLDTAIVNDTKLLIIADRLYSKGGLMNDLIKEASREKAETGKIVGQNALQTFIDYTNTGYDRLIAKFVRIDSIYVDSLDIMQRISQIETWQNSVQNDPDIKNATTLGVWERRDAELLKLRRYRQQLQAQ